MKERIITGMAAALAAVFLPLGLMGMGTPKPDAVPTQIPQALPSGTPEVRKISAIVIHEAETGSRDEAVTVTVTLNGTPKELSLSDYLCGVVMGEMPASFPLEALKAQAVAARTYTLRRLMSGGVLSDDPAVCQAYCDPDSAQEKFGDGWETYLEKLRQAVSETDGQVMTYDGELISATYFSCSGGRTESAQAVWGSQVPYLVSVDSPGEEDAASYESAVTVELPEFLQKLDIQEPAVGTVTYTEGGGVDTLEIGGKIFTGVELRELFDLRSTCFDLEITEGAVTFQVRGFGHRVGMSQYGAKAMAEAGCGYGEILSWYYTGAELTAWEE